MKINEELLIRKLNSSNLTTEEIKSWPDDMKYNNKLKQQLCNKWIHAGNKQTRQGEHNEHKSNNIEGEYE